MSTDPRHTPPAHIEALMREIEKHPVNHKVKWASIQTQSEPLQRVALRKMRQYKSAEGTHGVSLA